LDEEEEEEADWRDYIALTVALLQTVLLPYVIIAALFVLSVIVLTLLLKI